LKAGIQSMTPPPVQLLSVIKIEVFSVQKSPTNTASTRIQILFSRNKQLISKYD
jgi:hypothetical protein